MAQERLSMRKILEILRLKYECGLSNREIARSVGAGYGTVSDYLGRFRAAGLEWPLSAELSDGEALEAVLFVGHRCAVPGRAVPDWARVHEELRRHKHLTLALVWEEYRREHPDGYGYSRFCEIYQAWRRTIHVTMRQIHRPGEKMFVDFSGGTIPIVSQETGEVVARARLFVAVLGYSNLTYAEPAISEDLPTWIGANVRALEYFGGVPEIAVPDNLKAGVSRACRYEPDLNPTYAEFAAHYGVAVVPARARKPRDKAKAEVGVQIAQRWILAVLRHRIFHGLDEVREAVKPLLEGLNARVMRRVGRSRREVFEAEERGALRALPSTRYETAEWKRARVNSDYHVEFEKHYYSVPYRHVHADVEVRATAATVEILKGAERIGAHARSRERFKHTTLDEHMPPNHRAMGEWDPERVEARAAKVGPATAGFVKELMSRRAHPVLAVRSCMGIFRLVGVWGAGRVERACERAAAYRSYSYGSVESILRRGLEGRPVRPRRGREGALPRHENLRGPDYFH